MAAMSCCRVSTPAGSGDMACALIVNTGSAQGKAGPRRDCAADAGGFQGFFRGSAKIGNAG
jgi:hypothetical protein